jgi:PAS domain S-box-containing protein
MKINTYDFRKETAIPFSGEQNMVLTLGQSPNSFKVLNNLSWPIAILNTKGIILFLNEEANKLTYLTSPALEIGHSIFEGIIHPWKGMAEGVFRRVIDEKSCNSVDISYRAPKGVKSHLEIRCNVISGQENTPEEDFILVEGRDITQRKIFESIITSIGKDLNNLIESANAIIIGTDSGGYITEWNENAAVVTGYFKQESYTKKIFEILLNGQADHPFLDAIQEVLNGEHLTNYELQIHTKDKRKLTLLINATPRKNVSDEVVGILLIGQDITELSEYRIMLEKKVEERTEALHIALGNEKKLVEMKNRFVSIASHEFKSPLSSISNHIKHLTEDLQISIEERLTRFQNIQNQVNHMSLLLDDILTIGKNESKLQANTKLVMIEDFLIKIIDEVRSATNHTHLVEFTFVSQFKEIHSDENLLRNVFINLLNNAIKFSPGKDSVYLSVGDYEKGVEIVVRDRGIGIEEADIKRVFEPFNRGKNAEKIKGTGLGLSIVNRAVETLGGKLSVESKPGEGTEFTIQFEVNKK